MRNLLWVGDAACQSGFARCTHACCDVLQKGWKVSILGLNYLGDPHPHPYDIYPAYASGDTFGKPRLPYLIRTLRPDVIVLQNDPWNIPAYMQVIKGYAPEIPVAGMIAVDGLNCRGEGMNDLMMAAFWTQFGLDQARRGGFVKPAAVVPLGVDHEIFRPLDRIESRRALGMPSSMDNQFIVGNVNRNQQRKRLDLTIEYFAEWLHETRISDAWLFLHVAPTGDMDGFDCKQLARYYGVHNRLIVHTPPVRTGPGDDIMAQTFSSFDVQVSTTQGEGFGLTTLEGMACGVPQIVPDWAALGEWTEAAAVKVPCTSHACTANTINVIGGIADKQQFVAALNRLYSHKHLRADYRELGIRLASKPQFQWEACGQRFADALEEALAELPEPDKAVAAEEEGARA